jgi:biotin carboxyl carrier protein
MRYSLRLAGESMDIDASVLKEAEGLELSIGKKACRVQYRRISQRCISLEVDGQSANVFVVREDHGKHIFVKGRCYFVQDVAKEPVRRSKRTSPGEVPGEVTPPMPAVVVRILVEVGGIVRRGQALIVVKAMKMETTLVSPADGRIKQINTTLNAKVSPGDVLVEIEEGRPDDD